MTLVVEKFGGTSVGTVERINCVADHLIQKRLLGERLVVVVSAMSGETNRLLELAKQLSNDPTPRECDVLLSTGEQVTIALLTLALHARGCQACSYTGGQVSIHTDGAYSKARILDIDVSRMNADLAGGKVVVVAGFQGVDNSGNITTLGRGGSDTTAVAIGAAIHADECRIYTDVDGVFTTDPRVVGSARCLEYMTYDEMLEMSSLGAKVLHLRSVELASKFRVPIRVLSSFRPGQGTLITHQQTESTMEAPYVSGIAFQRNEAKLSILGIPDNPRAVSQILGAISDAGINVDIIIQNTGTHGFTDLSFTVSGDDYRPCLEILYRWSKKLGAEHIQGDNEIAKVSIVGVGMRSHCGIAKRMLDALANKSIKVKMVSTSEIKISVVLDERHLEAAVNALHDAFGLSQEIPALPSIKSTQVAHA